MPVLEREARSFTKNTDDAPSLGIALPVRKRSPVDFWMSLYQLMPPLNTKIGFMIQKSEEKDKNGNKIQYLPAETRNILLERAIEKKMNYVFYLDDDVLFPDITLYRMWVSMQKHPEIACITAVGCTKLTPTEPLIYQDGKQGAWWDFQLGALTPIHSAWAGCMLVNMDYVRRLEAPWFNDVITPETEDTGHFKRNVWGQDRYFHMRLREEAGGLVMADTGILVGHYDADLQKCYILPPDAPCFNKPILGESFITFFDNSGYVNWRRIVVQDHPDKPFTGYLDWLASQTPPEKEMSLLQVKEEQKKPIQVEEKEGFTVLDNRGRESDFAEWFKEIGADEKAS